MGGAFGWGQDAKYVIHVLDVSSWHGIANDHARVPVPLVDQWMIRMPPEGHASAISRVDCRAHPTRDEYHQRVSFCAEARSSSVSGLGGSVHCFLRTEYNLLLDVTLRKSFSTQALRLLLRRAHYYPLLSPFNLDIAWHLILRFSILRRWIQLYFAHISSFLGEVLTVP